jgi:hypothetical protein
MMSHKYTIQNHHIDFSSMIYDFDGSGIESGSYFMPNKKRCKHNNFCDKPINDNLCLTYDNFIRKVSKQKFNKKNYHYLKSALNSVSDDDIHIKQFKESYFESLDERHVLYIMDIEYKFVEHCELSGIFDTISNKYIVVGCCWMLLQPSVYNSRRIYL